MVEFMIPHENIYTEYTFSEVFIQKLDGYGYLLIKLQNWTLHSSVEQPGQINYVNHITVCFMFIQSIQCCSCDGACKPMSRPCLEII